MRQISGRRSGLRRSILLTLFLCIVSSNVLAQDDEPDLESLRRLSGKEIYAQFCSRCHGDDGTGSIDPAVLENLEAPPPDLTDPYFSSREKRSDWLAVAKYGGPVRGLSMSMPAWGEVFSDAQLAETVEVMKSFVDQSRYPQGELNFIRAHSVTKAFVEQEALLIPTYTVESVGGVETATLRNVLYYANRFGNRFQYELKLPLIYRTSNSSATTGFGDAELGLKYAFYDDYRSLTIFTTGVELGVPTGSQLQRFGSGKFALTPFFAAGQGVGKNIQMQASVKFKQPLDGGIDNGELRYAFSTTLLTTDGKQGFFPGIELSGTKPLDGRGHGVVLIPKLYWGVTPRGHLAMSVGTEIPVAGTQLYRYRVVAFVLWDYVDGGLWW